MSEKDEIKEMARTLFWRLLLNDNPEVRESIYNSFADRIIEKIEKNDKERVSI